MSRHPIDKIFGHLRVIKDKLENCPLIWREMILKHIAHIEKILIELAA